MTDQPPSPEAPEPQQATQPPTPKPAEQNNPSDSSSQAPPSGNTSKYLAILVGLAVIVGVVAGIYFFGKSQEESESVQPTATPTAIVSPTTDPTANWETYTNSIFKFSFSYPAELTYLHNQLKQPGDNLLLQNFKDSPERQESPEDFQLALFVSIDDGTALDEFPKSWESELGEILTEELTIGGKTAIKGLSGQKQQAVPTVWVKNEGFLYTFQLSNPKSTKAELFNQILSTFEFID